MISVIIPCYNAADTIVRTLESVEEQTFKDYEVVLKKTVETPDELHGIVKCNNPKCITNNEPMQTYFSVVDKENGLLKCHYCDKEQDIVNVKLC